jgi:hypothetical protein
MNLQYRAVSGRVAVHLDSLNLSINNSHALEILFEKGFREIKVDIVALARSRIGVSKYERGARLCEAPAVFDCSSFMKWLYGERGIWLPRRSIQQREKGEIIERENVQAGDLVFTDGYQNYYITSPDDGVGHVGILTDEGTVIHAATKKVGVIESSFDRFTEGCLRGIRRIIPAGIDVITLETPPEREVETSDDLRWIIFQSLPY